MTIVILLIIIFCFDSSFLYAQELRGLESKKSDDLLATSGRVIRIGSGYDDGVLDGSKKSKIIKRTIKATTTTVGLILGANPVGIVAGNVGVYSLRRKLKKDTGCSNIYKNCCVFHKGICEQQDGLTYCCDGEIKTDCNCNN